MKKIYKFIVCLLLISTIQIPLGQITTKAEESIAWMDQFLEKIGMSSELINSLSEGKKQMICKHLDLNSEFLSYSEKHISFDEDGNIMTTSDSLESDVTFSIALAKTNLSTDLTYVFFPSFTWHKVEKVKNDSFSCALYPGWGIVDYEESNLEIWLKNSYGDKVQSSSCSPKSGTDRAITFRFDSIQSNQILSEGNAVFYAKDYAGNSMELMYMHYFHDNTYSRDMNYQILLPSLQVFNQSSDNYKEKLKPVEFDKDGNNKNK